MKAAMGPPLVVVKAEMIFVTVESVGMLTVVNVVDGKEVKSTVLGAATLEETDDKGEHPKKSGMLTL